VSAGTRAPARSPSPQADSHPAAQPTTDAAAQPSSRPSPSHSTAPRQPGPAAACAPGDVMLTLFTPRYWYQRGQLPQFVVAAVSTSEQPCRFNMGARYVSVAVSYDGARIWSSADCVRGAGSRSVVLAKGRPAISWITWSRKTAVPGCRPEGHTARGGTYIATAVTGRFHTQGIVFVLSAPGVAVP
jgi:hypothetical protein